LKAIEKDPATLRPMRVWRYSTWHNRGFRREDAQERLQVRQWAEKALRLDDTLAEAHTALARAHSRSGIGQAQSGEYRGHRAQSQLSVAHIWFAQYLSACNGLRSVTQAKRRPATGAGVPVVNTWAGAAYFYAAALKMELHACKGAGAGSQLLGCEHVLARAYLKQGWTSRPSQNFRRQ